MTRILYIIGVVTIVIGLIIGVLSGSVLGFILSIVGSFVSAVIFLALGLILEKQDTILDMLQSLEEKSKPRLEKITCKKCEKPYTTDYSACPHCAYKPGLYIKCLKCDKKYTSDYSACPHCAYRPK